MRKAQCLVSFLLTYKPDHAFEVSKQTDLLLQSDPTLLERLENTMIVFESLQRSVPQTEENWGSGHFFPIVEAWHEAQVSFNLSCLGFYKQAMTSLRSVMELGILNIYWNLNDRGHEDVRPWFIGNERTPFSKSQWAKLVQNVNIKEFDSIHNLKDRTQDMGFLHDFVHTRGRSFSNNPPGHTDGHQVFDGSRFERWFEAFEEVTEIVTLLHLLKFPISICGIDLDRKFGINKPLFGVLPSPVVPRIRAIVGEEYWTTLQRIINNDQMVQTQVSDLRALPDLTTDEQDDEIIQLDRELIRSMGFDRWLQHETSCFPGFPANEKQRRRLKCLREWAIDNGLVYPTVKAD